MSRTENATYFDKVPGTDPDLTLLALWGHMGESDNKWVKTFATYARGWETKKRGTDLIVAIVSLGVEISSGPRSTSIFFAKQRWRSVPTSGSN